MQVKSKVCRTCKKPWPIKTHFYKMVTKTGYEYIYKDCKKCHVKNNKKRRRKNPEHHRTYGREYQRRWRKKHPGRMRRLVKAWQKKNRKHYLATRRAAHMRKHGLTLIEYHLLVKAQGGRCAICRKRPRGKSPAMRKLHVDHCHATGKRRELLCVPCNRGLGYFHDNPKDLRAAADYLERHA